MHELDRLQASCLLEIEDCDSLRKIDLIKNAIFGKNGKLSGFLKNIKGLSDEKKREVGARANAVRAVIQERLEARSRVLEMAELDKKLAAESVDVTLPSRFSQPGTLHPLTKVIEEVAGLMSTYGFVFADGPDIESEYYNFAALNMPDHHPARTMHDTFYINTSADDKGRKLLRTHTSPVQIRAMLANQPPFRFFSIGRVFRSDYDATHTPMFNQIECLMVDDNVGFSNLKWFISGFLRKFFGAPNLQLRFRPSFFPFTEPSAEVDLNYDVVNGKIVFGSGQRWMEIGGAGMVHPNVLESGNVDPSKYRGFAFGCGLERMASLKYGVPDLRGYFESNERWRNNFGFNHATRE